MMKKLFAMFMAAALLLGVSGCSSTPSIKSSYDNAKAYTSYLEKAKGDDNDIEGFIDDSTGVYMVDLMNNSDYFWMGQIVVMDADGKKIGTYETTLVRPHGYYPSYDEMEGVPDTFLNNKNQFYEFTYPDAATSYELIYDITSDYSEEWYNVLFNGEATLEEVIAAAKHQYAVCVITDDYYASYFFYGPEYTTYYDEEYQEDYPDSDSAVYGAGLDFTAKTITIYQNNSGSWDEIETITMD